MPLYGNFFACLRRLDAPSIDCLTSVPEQVPWFIGRLASSAAELEGKRVVMCETSDHSQRYRPAGDKRPVVTVSKAQIRGTCNRLMLAGVNAITSYYTFAGLNDPDLQELNLWVGRCCSVLAESSPSADVAVLFPVESIWPRFIPARHLANAAPEASRIESVFHSVTEGLYASGQDFIYTDAESLSRAEVKGGELVLGKQHWRTVILPGADTLELGTWKKLSAFVLQGGTLLFVAKTPANSTEEFPSKEVLKISGELVGAPGVENKLNVFGKGRVGFIAPGQESLVPATVAGLLNPEIEFVGPHPKQLRYARRLGPGPKATYFVINDSNEGWTGEVKILSSSPGQEWDPNTGQRRSVKLEAIPASFRPYDARFYVVDSEFVRRSPSAGARLPELKSVELEYNAPAVGRGEFVREKVTSLNATNPGGGHEFSALITKSDVDTFLFARLEKASDWSLVANDFIEFRSRVPRGQLTSSQLLVILHEEGGADYFASSGRWLNAEGEEKTIVPFSQFQLAGWSTDGNSRLNLDDITEIRIGWGGYFGKQGETVTFSVEDLKIGSVLGRTSQAKR